MTIRVWLTGKDGYIGSVLRPALEGAGMTVAGMDTGFYRATPPLLHRDIRDANFVLSGDAMVHLAALSNDPLGEINESLTYDINFHATVRLAKMAKEAGVRRFVFASSQSIYGFNDSDYLDEFAPKNPLTAYAKSKWLAEQAVMELADDDFCIVALRPATVFGWSPMLRTDIVFNNLLAQAYTTGEILLNGDGMEWRPVVHIQDLCDAFIACLEAPAAKVNRKAYNVGRRNYRIAELADRVKRLLPSTKIIFGKPSMDVRSYRTNGERIVDDLGVECNRGLLAGGSEMLGEFKATNFTPEDMGCKTNRLAQLKWLIDGGKLDAELRWR